MERWGGGGWGLGRKERRSHVGGGATHVRFKRFTVLIMTAASLICILFRLLSLPSRNHECCSGADFYVDARMQLHFDVAGRSYPTLQIFLV